MIPAETDAASGSVVSVMWLKSLTGRVVVLGEATNTVTVSSSKLVMKAISHPLTTPGITNDITRTYSA